MNGAVPATIVVVTFHSEEVIGDCLRSVPDCARVIVVDNGSRDDTVGRARAARPDAEIVALESNVGFGRASNVGLRMVETPYALLLNPDCTLSNGALERLVGAADAHADFAILGPAEHGGGREDLPVRVEAVADVVGAGMVLRMDVFRRIGFFDEKLFLFGEDNELCARAQDAGTRVGIVHGAAMTHLVARSAQVDGYSPDLRDRLMGQSAAYVLVKRGGPVVGRLLCLRKLAVYLAVSLRHRVSGDRAALQRLRRRGLGIVDFLAGGEAILFRNCLALRPRDPLAAPHAAVPKRL